MQPAPRMQRKARQARKNTGGFGLLVWIRKPGDGNGVDACSGSSCGQSASMPTVFNTLARAPLAHTQRAPVPSGATTRGLTDRQRAIRPIADRRRSAADAVHCILERLTRRELHSFRTQDLDLGRRRRVSARHVPRGPQSKTNHTRSVVPCRTL